MKTSSEPTNFEMRETEAQMLTYFQVLGLVPERTRAEVTPLQLDLMGPYFVTSDCRETNIYLILLEPCHESHI